MMFSATLNQEIRGVCKKFMSNVRAASPSGSLCQPFWGSLCQPLLCRYNWSGRWGCYCAQGASHRVQLLQQAPAWASPACLLCPAFFASSQGPVDATADLRSTAAVHSSEGPWAGAVGSLQPCQPCGWLRPPWPRQMHLQLWHSTCSGAAHQAGWWGPAAAPSQQKCLSARLPLQGCSRCACCLQAWRVLCWCMNASTPAGLATPHCCCPSPFPGNMWIGSCAARLCSKSQGTKWEQTWCCGTQIARWVSIVCHKAGRVVW